MKKPDFLHVDADSQKFTDSCRFVVKNGCGHFRFRTLELAASQEGINGES